jgi:hypothetical protein
MPPSGVATPFPLEIAGSGANVSASFFNGKDRYPSTQGRFENGKVYAGTQNALVVYGLAPSAQSANHQPRAN